MCDIKNSNPNRTKYCFICTIHNHTFCHWNLSFKRGYILQMVFTSSSNITTWEFRLHYYYSFTIYQDSHHHSASNGGQNPIGAITQACIYTEVLVCFDTEEPLACSAFTIWFVRAHVSWHDRISFEVVVVVVVVKVKHVLIFQRLWWVGTPVMSKRNYVNHLQCGWLWTYITGTCLDNLSLSLSLSLSQFTFIMMGWGERSFGLSFGCEHFWLLVFFCNPPTSWYF